MFHNYLVRACLVAVASAATHINPVALIKFMDSFKELAQGIEVPFVQLFESPKLKNSGKS